jgi:sulfite reductase (NADPH) flavoprotein alpha-component
MRENAAELWKWLDSGAQFYVCGDALRMAKDVDAALRTIVQEQSGKSAEQASAYVEQMKVDKRYKRDVY